MLILAKQFCQGWRCPPLSSKKVIITQFYSQVRKQKKLEQQVTIMPFKIVTNKLGNVKCIHFNGCIFYSRFFRMSPQRFDHLLTLVGPRIRKNDTNFREAIPPAESLSYFTAVVSIFILCLEINNITNYHRNMWCNLCQPFWQLPTPSTLGQWLD